MLHYKFQLTLSDETNEIRGRAEIEIQFKVDGVSKFALDLIGQPHPDSTKGMIVSAITQREQAVAFSHRNQLSQDVSAQVVERDSLALPKRMPFGISTAGEIVGWYRDGVGFIHGFSLTRNGVFTTIEVGNNTEAFGINAAGDIVGFFKQGFGPGSIRGFLLTR